MSLVASIGPNGEFYKPTIKPTPGFNPETDAQILEKAMKGLGTDEDAITAVLGRRTIGERLAIENSYKSLFGKDLEKQLKSELGGNYEKLALALLRTPAKHLAYCCYKAIYGAGTDEKTLAQILGCSTNQEIRDIKEAYLEVLQEHGKSPSTLEKDVESDCGGCFQNVLIALLQANRKEPTEADMKAIATKGVTAIIDVALAEKQARELFEAGEGRLGTDESTFIRMLVSPSVWQIAAIDVAYLSLTSNSLVDAIKNELSGDLRTVMKLIVESSLDRPATFAKLLHKAIEGFGTDDDTLIRIVASRADIDLESIKEAYQEAYGKSLAEDVKGDTSGDYRKLLLTLLNES